MRSSAALASASCRRASRPHLSPSLRYISPYLPWISPISPARLPYISPASAAISGALRDRGLAHVRLALGLLPNPNPNPNPNPINTLSYILFSKNLNP